MPLYEYECPRCGLFERMQKFSDPILTACPTCEKPVEKLVSAPAIQFKGTGWYVTDYSGKSSGGKDRDATDGKDAKDGKAGKDKDAKVRESKASGDGARDSKGSDTKQASSTSDTKQASSTKKGSDARKT